MDKTLSLKYIIENLDSMKSNLPYSEATFVAGLVQDLKVIQSKVMNYENAMQWFCDRVERRKISAVNEYEVFCKLLGREIKG